MKKVVLIAFAAILCVTANAQKNAKPIPNSKGTTVVSTGPKAPAAAKLIGKSSGEILKSQFTSAQKVEMTDGSTVSSFQMTVSCAGMDDQTLSNTANNQITKEMYAMLSRANAGCTLKIWNIMVNGKAAAAISLTIK